MDWLCSPTSNGADCSLCDPEKPYIHTPNKRVRTESLPRLRGSSGRYAPRDTLVLHCDISGTDAPSPETRCGRMRLPTCVPRSM